MILATQSRGKVLRPRTRVGILYPTADGVISGEGAVLNVIDKAPCGASGGEQFIYLVRLGDDLRVVPAEYLTPKGDGQ